MCVVAGGAGGGPGEGGVVAGKRYVETEGVNVKVKMMMASSSTVTSHMNESWHI